VKLDQLKAPSTAGRFIFAAGMVLFGSHLFLHATVAGIGPTAGAWAMLSLWQSSLSGLALVAAGSGLAARWKIRWAGALVMLVLTPILVVQFSRLAANVHNPGPWGGSCEILGLFCVALVLAGGESGRTTAVARTLLGLAFIEFASQHFLYPRFVALFMPAWIPMRQVWAYAAAVSWCLAALCFLAAPFVPLARRLAPLAATLLGGMWGIFFLSVHLFRIAHAPSDGTEWSAGFMALSWCGGMWIVAGALARKAATPSAH